MNQPWSEVSQKDKDQYSILTHIYGIYISFLIKGINENSILGKQSYITSFTIYVPGLIITYVLELNFV